MFYGHSYGEDKSQWEPLIKHLQNVAESCGSFCDSFGFAEWGRLAGLLHDLGKYSKEFQQRLEGSSIRVDHATAGAVTAQEKYNEYFGILFAYLAAGHHTGLPDYGSINRQGSLAMRLYKAKERIPDYSRYKEEIKLDDIPLTLPEEFKRAIMRNSLDEQSYLFYFLIKMLFSSLVDSDFLETEKFLNSNQYMLRKKKVPIEILASRFEAYMQKKSQEAEDNPINQSRSKIFQCCIKAASRKPGIFTFTVPTGGGKTLSSMAFALEHAKQNDLERIIYVIPYTSIIEQTAGIFKDIFGQENVLEHHSNFDFEKGVKEDDVESGDNSSAERTLKLASENWDMPIIVTTNVQFFESIYANKTSRTRKLHNLANSVIIFDEAQMLPMEYLKPALECICELTERYRVSAVLCTATLPAIQAYLRKGAMPVEIVPKTAYDKETFKRTEFEFAGKLSEEKLVDLLNEFNQVLCVVNTKKKARAILEHLEEHHRYHLSGNMCPVHRQEVLKEIKARLMVGEPIKVVTTQLIEAGVDIDFPVVCREAAGLDSMIQAAGRCNREGKLEKGRVLIFERTEDIPKGHLARTASYGLETIRTYQSDSDAVQLPIDSPEAIEFYFRLLFSKENLDKKDIMKKISDKPMKYPFKEIAESFKLIESGTVPIIIPYDDEARTLIRDLPYAGSQAVKKLQKYTVNVYGSMEKDFAGNYPSEYQRLVDNGSIQLINGVYPVLNYDGSDPGRFYSEEVGLLFKENMIW